MITTDTVLWKECLNSGGQQFNKYQQNKQSPLNSLNIEMTTTYDVRNPGPDFGQAQKQDGVKPNNGTLYW